MIKTAVEDLKSNPDPGQNDSSDNNQAEINDSFVISFENSESSIPFRIDSIQITRSNVRKEQASV